MPLAWQGNRGLPVSIKWAAMELQAVQERLLNDDQEAVRLLYVHLGNRLFQLAYAIVKSREVSEEIVSDVLLQVWKNRERMARMENLRLYLYVSIKNRCFSHLRRSEEKSRPQGFDEWYLPYYQLDKSPEELMISGEMLQHIHNAINSLPVKCRLIFKLAKEDGLKHREIAELLGLSVKTVENQMGIALQKIYTVVKLHFPRISLPSRRC